MFKLGQDIRDLEAILTNLPEEDVDSQLAITRVSLESLEALEATASDIESQLNDEEKTKESEWTSWKDRMTRVIFSVVYMYKNDS